MLPYGCYFKTCSYGMYKKVGKNNLYGLNWRDCCSPKGNCLVLHLFVRTKNDRCVKNENRPGQSLHELDINGTSVNQFYRNCWTQPPQNSDMGMMWRERVSRAVQPGDKQLQDKGQEHMHVFYRWN